MRRIDSGGFTAGSRLAISIGCALVERAYEKGIKITDAEIEALDIRGDTFHPGRVAALSSRASES